MQPSSGGSGLMGAVVQGFGFGAGSSLAHRLFDAPRQVEVVPSSGASADTSSASAAAPSHAEDDPCASHIAELNKCMKSGSAGSCQWLFDSVKDCQTQMRAERM